MHTVTDLPVRLCEYWCWTQTFGWRGVDLTARCNTSVRMLLGRNHGNKGVYASWWNHAKQDAHNAGHLCNEHLWVCVWKSIDVAWWITSLGNGHRSNMGTWWTSCASIMIVQDVRDKGPHCSRDLIAQLHFFRSLPALPTEQAVY